MDSLHDITSPDYVAPMITLSLPLTPDSVLDLLRPISRDDRLQIVRYANRQAVRIADLLFAAERALHERFGAQVPAGDDAAPGEPLMTDESDASLDWWIAYLDGPVAADRIEIAVRYLRRQLAAWETLARFVLALFSPANVQPMRPLPVVAAETLLAA